MISCLILTWLDAVYVSNDKSASNPSLRTSALLKWDGSVESEMIEAELVDLLDLYTEKTKMLTIRRP